MSVDVRASGGEPRPRALAIGALFFLIAVLFWFGLGMHRGLLLSNDVKSMTWPWAPNYPRPEIAAPALSDPVWQFVPWLTEARNELSRGRLPLWNPHQDGGVPLLGNAQSALGSPLLWPPLLFGVPAAWNFSLLLRLLLAFIAVYAWLRDSGRSVSAAALGGFAFALSGPFIAWLEHPHTAAAAPVPLLLLFTRRLARAFPLRHDRTIAPKLGGGPCGPPNPLARSDAIGLAAATFLVLVGGHPETQLMAAVLAAGYLLFLAPRGRALVTILVSAAVGVLLAAPVLVPFIEYFSLSEARLGLDREPFVLPVADLLRLIVPSRAGSNVIEGAATVSVTALLLAVAGLTRWKNRETRFWLIVTAGILLVAYENPLARLLAEKTPIYWTRTLLFLPLPLGYLAAESWDGIRALLSRRKPRWLLRAAGVLGPALVAVELLAAARGVHGSTPPEDLARTPPILARLREDPAVFRILPLHTFLPTNTATDYGLDDVRGYDALAPRGWRRRREEMGRFVNVPTQRGVLEPWDLAPGGRALDVWNVKYLLLDPRFAFSAQTLNARKGLDLVEVYSGPDGKLLLNRRALPRVRLEAPGRVEIRKRDPMRWVIDVETPSDNALTLANPYFPGWRARLDGNPVALHGAPGDPLQLRVPAGRHRVALLYRPASFLLGLLAAGAGLIAGLVFLRRLR